MEKCFKQFTVKRAILLHIQISGNRSSGISVPFDLIQDFQEFSVEKYAFFLEIYQLWDVQEPFQGNFTKLRNLCLNGKFPSFCNEARYTFLLIHSVS